jgi:hypothetical protein
MTVRMRFALLLGAFAITFVGVQPAHSALVFQGDLSAQGSGYSSTSIMVFSKIGTESGCVNFANATGQGACDTGTITPRLSNVTFPYTPANTFGEQNGQTQTRSVTDSGAINAWDFRLVLNLNQGTGNPLTVNDLVVKFYTPTGTLVWHSAELSAFSAVILSEGGGTGASGKVFYLSDPDATALQAAVFSQANFGNYRIGVEVNASDGASGNEGISASNNGGVAPEPSTWLSLAAGLLLLGALAKRR